MIKFFAFIFVRMGFLLPKRRKTASAFGSMRKLTAAIGIGGESNFRYFFARIRPFAIPP
jgi:hypothetical protein